MLNSILVGGQVLVAAGSPMSIVYVPVPGTGIYTIDMGDPAATNTWPPTRMEFNMKDQMARNKIDVLVKEIEDLNEEIKLLRK